MVSILQRVGTLTVVPGKTAAEVEGNEVGNAVVVRCWRLKSKSIMAVPLEQTTNILSVTSSEGLFSAE